MKCEHCGQIVPDTAKVCGYCGARLKAAPQTLKINPHFNEIQPHERPVSIKVLSKIPPPLLIVLSTIAWAFSYILWIYNPEGSTLYKCGTIGLPGLIAGFALSQAVANFLGNVPSKKVWQVALLLTFVYYVIYLGDSILWNH